MPPADPPSSSKISTAAGKTGQRKGNGSLFCVFYHKSHLRGCSARFFADGVHYYQVPSAEGTVDNILDFPVFFLCVLLAANSGILCCAPPPPPRLRTHAAPPRVIFPHEAYSSRPISMVPPRFYLPAAVGTAISWTGAQQAYLLGGLWSSSGSYALPSNDYGPPPGHPACSDPLAREILWVRGKLVTPRAGRPGAGLSHCTPRSATVSPGRACPVLFETPWPSRMGPHNPPPIGPPPRSFFVRGHTHLFPPGSGSGELFCRHSLASEVSLPPGARSPQQLACLYEDGSFRWLTLVGKKQFHSGGSAATALKENMSTPIETRPCFCGACSPGLSRSFHPGLLHRLPACEPEQPARGRDALPPVPPQTGWWPMCPPAG